MVIIASFDLDVFFFEAEHFLFKLAQL